MVVMLKQDKPQSVPIRLSFMVDVMTKKRKHYLETNCVVRPDMTVKHTDD